MGSTASLRLAEGEFKGSLRKTNAPLSDFHGLAVVAVVVSDLILHWLPF
jgi:hypothetical protein